MSKHTPGPWKREGLTVYALMSAGWLKGKELFKNRFWANLVCDASCSKEEAEANARLVAAAPELLDACIDARRWLAGWASAEPYISLLDAAIAKATGDGS